jgi:hypothetical protein
MSFRSGRVSKKHSMEKHDAFSQLNAEDQKAAIDVAVAAVLIGLRIPSTGKPLYDWMATEFASTRSLPPNVVKYALRSLGQALFRQNWTLIIEKDKDGIITKFTPEWKEGDDGDQILQN